MTCAYCHDVNGHPKATGLKKAEFELYRCDNCGNEFLVPLPSDNELFSYYQNTYLNRTEGHVVRKESPTTGFYYRLIKRWNPGAKLVYEVGPSEGNLLLGLKNRGFDVTGYELSKKSAELGRKILNVDIIPAALPQNQESKCDVLISSHVAEHLNAPPSRIHGLRQQLKAGRNSYNNRAQQQKL